MTKIGYFGKQNWTLWSVGPLAVLIFQSANHRKRRWWGRRCKRWRRGTEEEDGGGWGERAGQSNRNGFMFCKRSLFILPSLFARYCHDQYITNLSLSPPPLFQILQTNWICLPEAFMISGKFKLIWRKVNAFEEKVNAFEEKVHAFEENVSACLYGPVWYCPHKNQTDASCQMWYFWQLSMKYSLNLAKKDWRKLTWLCWNWCHMLLQVEIETGKDRRK